jgi:hypothetical protein
VCADHERHRSLFTVNLQFIAPAMIGRDTEVPELKVCFNAENIWECRIPREVSGLNKRVVFEKLPDVRTALRVLKRGTYWFPQLLKKKKLKSSAFGRSMARLLAGKTSPDGTEPLGLIKSMKVSTSAVHRLRSALATVDGLMMQALLAFPGNADIQSWKRIDQIQRSGIANMVADYFRDNDPERVTTFEKVKKVRKDLKQEIFNPVGSPKRVVVPRELSAMRVLLSLIREKTPLSHLQGTILSQTRASGVPPQVLYDKTLAKTKAILTKPSDRNLYNRLARPIARGVDVLWQDFLQRLGGVEKRDSFWESTMRESKISLSDSGEFFTPTDEGGKLEAARKVLETHPVIRKVNLHTGEMTDEVIPITDTSQGERLFHWALQCFRNRKGCYDNNSMSCRISLVAELGKFRTITVSTLQHALVLHPLSHMGLKFLEVFPSSESGIGAANHAWNLFKRLSHNNPSAAFLFKEDLQVVVMSTDWKTATDFCDHFIARAMLNRLLAYFGVPQWYRETVLFALTAPRQVETLDRTGCPVSKFYTSRGVLMGDPLTKVVLHLYHLIGRRIMEDLLFRIFKENVLDESDHSDDEGPSRP